MRVIVERGKRRYEAVPCGARCSFARDDSDGEPIYNDGSWQATHCCHDCYLPKWFGGLYLGDQGAAWGLRELKEVEK